MTLDVDYILGLHTSSYFNSQVETEGTSLKKKT